MKGQSTGPVLSTIFVDYDNIYQSLKRRNEEAAKRFSRDAHVWLREIANGRLITTSNGPKLEAQRRMVMLRCYGNSQPRRNANDGSTDMNSFPFVRHHFLRAGFEVIECPPLTAQLKNSADIKMVMDVRDYLNHDTYFDEFVILSGDADFTPVLQRLRAHARGTVIYTNDRTAAPYTSISDGEVRENDLLALLLDGRVPADGEQSGASNLASVNAAQLEAARNEILGDIVAAVRSSNHPLPLEALADRAVRSLGHSKTVGTSWGGAGSFRDLLARHLPDDVRLSDQPPYYVFDANRQLAAAPERIELREPSPAEQPIQERRPGQQPPPETGYGYESMAMRQPAPKPAPQMPQVSAPPQAKAPIASQPQAPAAAPTPPAAARQQAPSAPQRAGDGATAIQKSIARIHEASQAPPLSPPEYRVLFDAMAAEINTNGLTGAQTLSAIAQRAAEQGVELRRDDIRFVLEVVSEPDPWFEQGASAKLFASRFRNFVVARCRSQGLSLSADELDLIEAWFAGAPPAQRDAAPVGYGRAAPPQSTPQQPAPPPAPQAPAADYGRSDRWWGNEDVRPPAADPRTGGGYAAPDGEGPDGDEFPRIVRTRLRG